MLLVEKRRLNLTSDPHEWVDEAFSRSPLRETPLNREVALRSRSVRTPHQDPADRFLAATAAVYDLAWSPPTRTCCAERITVCSRIDDASPRSRSGTASACSSRGSASLRVGS
jgi:hypothetical protein